MIARTLTTITPTSLQQTLCLHSVSSSFHLGLSQSFQLSNVASEILQLKSNVVKTSNRSNINCVSRKSKVTPAVAWEAFGSGLRRGKPCGIDRARPRVWPSHRRQEGVPASRKHSRVQRLLGSTSWRGLNAYRLDSANKTCFAKLKYWSQVLYLSNNFAKHQASKTIKQ